MAAAVVAIALCAALAVFVLTGRASPHHGVAVKTGFALGTLVQIRAYGDSADEAASRAFARVQEIEAKMSPGIRGSEVAAINRKAGGLPTRVSEDTLYVVEKARRYGELSRGKFDAAIGPLVQLWGVGTRHAKVPGSAEIVQARSRVDYRQIEIDAAAGTVRLGRAEMALDLGGIAKGFAADEAALAVSRHGVKSAFVDLGGNILVVGSRPDGTPWRVGIQDPWQKRGVTFASLTVRDAAVVTSGTYERYFERDGKRYHHIFDPGTGFPADTDVVSATVLARTSADADALSTIVVLLGSREGMKLLCAQPEVEGVIVTRDRRVIVSSGLKGRIRVQQGWAVEFHDT